jgi:small subunit ribosomal protein S16
MPVGPSNRTWRCILLAIRLTRMGAKKKPFYRINVTEKRTKRDGSFVEIVGYYDPCRNPAEVKINHERLNYWIERGAQPSETVRSLIKRAAKATAPTAEANG